MIKAQWRKLVMANYAIDSQILEKYLPVRTQYDLFHGEVYVSLVGFMFMETSILGIKFPFHTNFEEVNLRFYVKRPHNEGWKRGVVFISEIVPLPTVTFIANNFYGEHYRTMPMKHKMSTVNDEFTVEYYWKKKNWNSLKIITGTSTHDMIADSEEDFFTQQYWGYNRVSENSTLEYEVLHPSWKFYDTKGYTIDVDFANIYGDKFSFLQNQKPKSIFLAEGSTISLKKGTRLSASNENK